MNILGNLGDPTQVAASLKPLIDAAEDKALAELHASVTVAVTALQQEIATTREELLKRIDAFTESLPDLALRIIQSVGVELDLVVEKIIPTITFGPKP